MLKCHDCGEVFEYPETRREMPDGYYGYETWSVCPACGSTELDEAYQCGLCFEWYTEDEGRIYTHVCNACAAESLTDIEAVAEYCLAQGEEFYKWIYNVEQFCGEFLLEALKRDFEYHLNEWRRGIVRDFKFHDQTLDYIKNGDVDDWLEYAVNGTCAAAGGANHEERKAG